MSNALPLLLGAGPKDALYLAHSAGARSFSHILFSHYLHVVRETGGKNHFLIARVPSKSDFLEPLGCFVKPVLKTDEGFITRATLEKSINPRVSLLSLPWADPVTGLIHPMHEIAEFCRDHEILLHIEGGAALGRIDFRIQDITPSYFSCDNIVFTEQTLYLPQVSPDLLTAATRKVEEKIVQFDRMATEVARLRDLLENALITASPHLQLPFKEYERVPDIAAFSCSHIHSDYLKFLLHRRGVPSQIVDDRTLSMTLPSDMEESHIQNLIGILSACIKIGDRVGGGP